MISAIIVTGKVYHGFCLLLQTEAVDNITEICYFGTVRLLRPKQHKVLYVNMEYMDLLPPTSPSLVYARETCTPYRHWSQGTYLFHAPSSSVIRGSCLVSVMYEVTNQIWNVGAAERLTNSLSLLTTFYNLVAGSLSLTLQYMWRVKKVSFI